MKRSKFFIFFFVCILFLGCNQQNSNRTAENEDEILNPTQKALSDLVKSYHDREMNLHNNLAIDELFDDFQSTLVQFFDTAKVINWTYYIEDLKSMDVVESGKTYKKVTFKLLSSIDKAPKIKFDATLFVNPDSINTDRTYNMLKTTTSHNKVTFSGFVVKHSDGLYIREFKIGDNSGYQIAYPDFDLLILDVTNVEKPTSAGSRL